MGYQSIRMCRSKFLFALYLILVDSHFLCPCQEAISVIADAFILVNCCLENIAGRLAVFFRYLERTQKVKHFAFLFHGMFYIFLQVQASQLFIITQNYLSISMKLAILKKKTSKQTQMENVIREQQFNVRYRLNEKPATYDPLNDVHVSYFFSSTPAKKQLRRLKKAARYQRNLTQKKRMLDLIDDRLRFGREMQQQIRRQRFQFDPRIADLKRLAKNSIMSLSTKSTRQNTNNFFATTCYQKLNKRSVQEEDEADYLSGQAQITPTHIKTEQSLNPQKMASSNFRVKKVTKQAIRAQKLRQQLHQLKHNRWMSFLEERKKIIRAQSVSSSDFDP